MEAAPLPVELAEAGQTAENEPRLVLPIDDIPEQLIPHEGMLFTSHDAAVSFYENYAKMAGFSVRLGSVDWTKTPEKAVRKRELLCHKAGVTPEKTVTTAQRSRPSTRCNCLALMRISLQTNDKLPEYGKWKVIHLRLEHNHSLLAPTITKYLPAYRDLSSD